MTAPAIGIDLGTSYSCVAVYRNGKAEIISDAEGNHLIPSVVSFGTNRLVGKAAKAQEAINPENTIYDVKRLIGRRFNDEHVQSNIKQWLFKVILEAEQPKIMVQHNGNEMSFFPEEISSMVLGAIKAIAEEYLGATVRNVVVSVPACFNDSQRQATKDAGAIAGLNILRIINEPTASALAYGLFDMNDKARNILIFDLGGGTYDVTILNIKKGVFEVRATAGDTHLGGVDFDMRLVEYFAAEFQSRFDCDLRGDAHALRRLLTASEGVKCELSSAEDASVNLEALYAGFDFQANVTRERFNQISADLSQAMLEPINQVLMDAKLDKEDIEEVVLVGGSSRIPAVQELLQKYFTGKEIKHSIDAEEAVACGAAIHAAMLTSKNCEAVKDLVLTDVTPLSLGIEIYGNIMDIIIPRNTLLPTSAFKHYTTPTDYETEIDIKILEGERTRTQDNNVLGVFILSGIPRAPRNVPDIKVTFKINADGILFVTATETSSKRKNSIKITNDKGRLNKEQIEKLIGDAENWKLEDKKGKLTAEAMTSLLDFSYNIKGKVIGTARSAARQKVLDMCDEIVKWINSEKNVTKKDYDRKKRELQSSYNMLLMD